MRHAISWKSGRATIGPRLYVVNPRGASQGGQRAAVEVTLPKLGVETTTNSLFALHQPKPRFADFVFCGAASTLAVHVQDLSQV